MQYTLSRISDIIGGIYSGYDVTINHIFVDSRNSINNNKNALFIAINGQRHSGHNYINDLYNNGIRNFIVDKNLDAANFPDANFITVNNTLKAIQDIAADYRNTFPFAVVGITGSNGKTIVKEWISQIFRDIKIVTRSPKSYNSQIGVPLSVLMANNNAELGIFEAGISLPDEMEKLEKILHPNIGIFTNIGDAHQENFDTIEQKVSEKLRLFKNSELLIYSSESKYISKAVLASTYNFKTFTWGYANESDLKILDKTTSVSGTRLVLQVKNKSTQLEIEVPFSDNASVENVMHTIAFSIVEGIDIDVLKKRLAGLIPVAMRLELKEGINNCTIINDTYNSDINSLSIALDFLGGVTQHPHKTIILSDILQSESNESKLYSQVSAMLQTKGISRFIGIGKALEKLSSVFTSNTDIADCRFYKSTDDFLQHFNKDSFNNEAILLKGSRQFRFEKISRLLELKIHQTIMEVNMNAMIHNLNYFKSTLKPGVKLMAMVKAFSYGHGFAEVAAFLQYHRVDYIAVAYADEGIGLREAGITMPIVILNTDPDNFDIMIEYQLEPEIYSLNSIRTFIATASRMGVCNYPIHIKADTGMHRLGFVEEDFSALCEILKNSQEVKAVSVFSHLAASDEKKHDDFTKSQINKFQLFCQSLEKEIGYTFIKHILNSSGIERFNDSQFDMVRLGIGLYGIGSPEMRKNLISVATLKSAIVQIKDIDKNETVGYGRCGVVKTPKRIATIPIGYADGVNRKLGNGAGYFTVNGKHAPIIGNVCMDACMIDITDINAKEGDKVTIMGDSPSVYEIANAVGTIPYEILTSISRRVKRVYISD